MMSKQTRVVWLADDRFVPGTGTPERGEELELADYIAEQCINAGLAKLAPTPKTKSKSEEDKS